MLRSRVFSLKSTKRRLNARKYSSNASDYPGKVRAVPFALSAPEAIRHMGIHASLEQEGHGLSPVINLFGSMGANLFPDSGFKPYMPERIQAVYLPTWFVDADITVNFKLLNNTEAWIDLRSINSYLPGLSYDPLSRLTLEEASLCPSTVPYTPELKRQLDSDVLCLPFTHSPLCFPEIGHSLLRYPNITEILGPVNPTALKVHLLAAYPVLLPVYLAQYEFSKSDSQTVKFTCLIQAHAEDGRIFVENDESEKFNLVRGQAGSFGLEGVASPLIPNEECIQILSNLRLWIKNSISQKNCLQGLSKFGVDMDDPRVREYVESEVSMNRTWIALGDELSNLKKAYTKQVILNERFKKEILERLGTLPLDLPGRSQMETKFQKLQDDEEELEDAIDSMVQRRNETKPVWLTDWETLQEKRRTV